jgi:hypothetical protein
MKRGAVAKHCGIVTGLPHVKFIHAQTGRGCIESYLDEFWRVRIAGIFDFPGVI